MLPVLFVFPWVEQINFVWFIFIMLFGFRSFVFGNFLNYVVLRTSNTTQIKKSRWPKQFSRSFQGHWISPFVCKEGKLCDCACLTWHMSLLWKVKFVHYLLLFLLRGLGAASYWEEFKLQFVRIWRKWVCHLWHFRQTRSVWSTWWRRQ